MNNKFLYGTIAFASIAAVVGVTSFVFAQQGNPLVKGPNYSEERHTAMEQALDNNDYEAWRDLMRGRGRVSQAIAENNFPRFAQMHELMLAGDTEEANSIRTELGLGTGGRYAGGCPMADGYRW